MLEPRSNNTGAWSAGAGQSKLHLKALGNQYNLEYLKLHHDFCLGTHAQQQLIGKAKENKKPSMASTSPISTRDSFVRENPAIMATMKRRLSLASSNAIEEFDDALFEEIDEALSSKLDDLLDKFPQPPFTRPQFNNSPIGSSKNNKSSNDLSSKNNNWGLKGIAERFNMFVK